MDPVNKVLTITGVLEDASRCYQTGNMAQADTLLRLVASRSDQHRADVLYLKGMIGIRLGLFESALSFLDSGCSESPGNRQLEEARNFARSKLATGEAGLSSDDASGARHRFLLIKAWGYGFWSDVNQVLGALLLAEMTGREPVIWWGANSLFSPAPDSNAFECFFQPVSTTSLADLEKGAVSFFPPKWNIDNFRLDDVNKWQGQYCRMSPLYLINRTEDVVVCDFHAQIAALADWIPASHKLAGLGLSELYRHIVERYIVVNSDIKAKAEQFCDERLSGSPFLAVHIRSADKILESPDLDRVNASYPALIDHYMAQCGCDRIFLLTDGQSVRDEFVERYGDRVVFTDATRSSDSSGVHYQASLDKVALGEEVLIDVLVALKARAFIGNGESSVSNAIAHLKDWDKECMHLINGCRWYEPNLVLYKA